MFIWVCVSLSTRVGVCVCVCVVKSGRESSGPGLKVRFRHTSCTCGPPVRPRFPSISSCLVERVVHPCPCRLLQVPKNPCNRQRRYPRGLRFLRQDLSRRPIPPLQHMHIPPVQSPASSGQDMGEMRLTPLPRHPAPGITRSRPFSPVL